MKHHRLRQIAASICAVSLVGSAAANARADLFGALLKLAREAASATLDPSTPALAAATEPAAAANHDDSKPAQAGQENKPAAGEQSPEEAAADAKAQAEFLKAGADVIDALFAGKPLDAVTALIAGTGAKLDRLLGPGIAAVTQPTLPMKIAPQDRDASMQSPTVTVVNPGDFRGDLVYFVNGVDVTRELALKQAEALARRINRPVGLIYNVTNGVAADLAESTYDRAWPLVAPLLPKLIQANNTTRQVAHLLDHATKPIAIVSHSQGCIIVRNALLMANTFTGGKAKDRLIWVATAMPLRDEEVCPKPARFRGITNRDDTVCQLIGLRLAPDKIDWENACATHDFVKGYLDEIKPQDLR
jgi:hypothetical protein